MEKQSFKDLGLDDNDSMNWKTEQEERQHTFNRIEKMKQRAYQRVLLERRKKEKVPEGVEVDENYRVVGREVPKFPNSGESSQ